jgi:uncharacterized protein YndB with AHSA1/START domain
MTTFRTSRQLLYSPEAIFSTIRDPKRFARWWGPDGFTNTFHHFAFEDGGRWSLTMHGPDGTNYLNESEFAEIVAPTLVRVRHISPPEFVLTISLQPQGDGTLVNWEQVFKDAKVAESVGHIVEPANEQNLDRLSAELGLIAKPSA